MDGQVGRSAAAKLIAITFVHACILTCSYKFMASAVPGKKELRWRLPGRF
jgi:hypothetical protein